MHPPRVLIVEDDKNLTDLLRRRLEMDGFEVLTAYGGIEGFKLALTGRPKLIIIDIILPDIDGLTMLRQIRAEDKLREVPVIIVTSYNELEYLGQAVAANVAEYILKAKTTPQEISKKVRALIEQQTAVENEL